MSDGVLVLASRVRLEERQIMTALEARGVGVEHVDTRNVFAACGAGRASAQLVLNREIGQVRAFYAAQALESAGARVVNSAEATRIAGDKWLSATALHEHGLPQPRTVLALTPESALKALEEIGYPAVIKPLVGSWGRMVTKVEDAVIAESVLEHVAALPSPQSHLVLLQELVPHAGRDLRVLVIGGRAVGATARVSTHWRTNVARGATSERHELSGREAELAEAAAAAVGAGIAGVDLIEDGQGAVHVLEVNDRVEFRGFQSAHLGRVDVADTLAAYLIEEMNR